MDTFVTGHQSLWATEDPFSLAALKRLGKVKLWVHDGDVAWLCWLPSDHPTKFKMVPRKEGRYASIEIQTLPFPRKPRRWALLGPPVEMTIWKAGRDEHFLDFLSQKIQEVIEMYGQYTKLEKFPLPNEFKGTSYPLLEWVRVIVGDTLGIDDVSSLVEDFVNEFKKDWWVIKEGLREEVSVELLPFPRKFELVNFLRKKGILVGGEIPYLKEGEYLSVKTVIHNDFIGWWERKTGVRGLEIRPDIISYKIFRYPVKVYIRAWEMEIVF